MAKQAGILPFTGTMGGISFYKSNGEYRAREKSGPSRRTVLTSGRFVRTRENAAEFRRAVRAGMLVRRSLHYLMKGYGLSDTLISGRLNAQLLKIIKADAVHVRGEKRVCAERLDMLEDFAFCKSHVLRDVLCAGPVSSIDTDSGRMQLQVRPFDPQAQVKAPAGATHFRIVSVAAAIDFEKEAIERQHCETGYLSLEEEMVEGISLEHVLQPTAGDGLLLAMGIVFYTCGEDGKYVRVSGGAMRVLQTACCAEAFKEGSLTDNTDLHRKDTSLCEVKKITHAEAQGTQGLIHSGKLSGRLERPEGVSLTGDLVSVAGGWVNVARNRDFNVPDLLGQQGKTFILKADYPCYEHPIPT